MIDHDKCTQCGKCIEKCPQATISQGADGKVTIDQEHCIGCGFCKSVCEFDAITLKQTMPLRESIHEYFEKEGRIDMVLDTCSMPIPPEDYQWTPADTFPAKVKSAVALHPVPTCVSIDVGLVRKRYLFGSLLPHHVPFRCVLMLAFATRMFAAFLRHKASPPSHSV